MAKSFEATEIVSLLNARKILDNWNDIKFSNPKHLNLSVEKDKLKNYILRNKGKHSKGKIPTSYHYSRGKKCASRQTVQGQGLQNLMREVRQTISHEYYDDVDMVNSVPTLLLNYCQMAGYSCDGIRYYVEHRKECFDELIETYKVSKTDAKMSVIYLINGSKPKNYQIKWYKDFCQDVSNFHKIITEHPAYSSRFDKISEKKKENVVGSVMSEIFHEIENKILLQCLAFLKNERISTDNVVLVFDGFMLPKDAHINQSHLTRLSQWVLEKTKYSVQYLIKPMDEVIDLTGFEIDENKELIPKPVIADNDNEASNILLETLIGQCFYCNGQIWLRTQSDRVFVSNEIEITNELINRCMLLNIEKSGKKKDYSANLSGARNIVATAINKIKTDQTYRDETFVDRMIAYTRGKIFFRNGFINMDTHEFVIEDDYEDYEIITPVRISYDVPRPENVNDDIGNELINRVLRPIFETEEMMNNYLEHIARAISGHIEDKDWLIMSGMRDCGKGVLTSLNKNTFGVYTSETSANYFLIERNHTQEDSKKYSWLKDNRWTRILHTSEVKFDNDDKMLKIDGNLIKNKLSSGGDVIEVRALYENTIRIKPQCRLFMMCNDVPPITPPDATQTLSKFNFPSKFLDEDKYEIRQREGTLNKHLMMKDPTIKDFVMNQEVFGCYIILVMGHYKNQKVKNCQKVIEDTTAIKADMGDETSLLNKYFSFTGSKTDILLSKEITDFHKKGHLNISINKLKDLLTFNGAIEDKHLTKDVNATKQGTQRGYYGIKLLKEENKNNLEDD